ncbi:hypothetical protein Pfo_008038 [Paulownia fortunei]|nr:hypothetical protein Pfo_008038 [Paulownia fortunei]
MPVQILPLNSHAVGSFSLSTLRLSSPTDQATEQMQPHLSIPYLSCPEKYLLSASPAMMALAELLTEWEAGTPSTTMFQENETLKKELATSKAKIKQPGVLEKAQGFLGELDAKGPLCIVPPVKGRVGDPHEDMSHPWWDLPVKLHSV